MDRADEYLELDSYFPDGCYALKVKGESMVDALISDGDLVLINLPEQLVSLLQITKLSDVLPQADSIEEAKSLFKN